MSTLSKTVVLAILALSASALTTPLHGAAHYGRHHAIARNAIPADVSSSPVAVPRAMQKRGRRCKPRQTSSSVAVPLSTNIAVVTSSQAPEPATSSKVEQPTTSSKAPEPTTSSKAPEPTTSSKAPEPTTSSKAPEPTTTEAPEPTTTKVQTTTQPTTTQSTGNLPSFMVGTQTGDGTFYATGLGACGIVNNDSEHIAAVSHLLFDNFPGYNGQNPNNNPMCGRTVTARRGSKSVVVALTDRCTGCKVSDLDFSPSAFNILGDPAEGRIPITWTWN
jgi:hypothetical protein